MNKTMKKIETGIPGLDTLTKGGFPEGRTTFVSGAAGSGKTILSAQYLVKGIKKYNQSGLFVTFEESPADIRTNLLGFEWPIADWEDQNKLEFIDVSHKRREKSISVGDYNLSALLTRMSQSVEDNNVQRVVIDSIDVLYNLLNEKYLVRNELNRIITKLNKLGLTTIITGESNPNEDQISRYGVEEFVSDNVILLKNEKINNKRRRTIEVLKFRGSDHFQGEYPLSILDGQGVTIQTDTKHLQIEEGTVYEKISTGIEKLDEMCGGGFFSNSLALIAGATGTGKTLTANHFIHQVLENDNRGVYFTFEESTEQFIRNAEGWGFQTEEFINKNKLKLISDYPESKSLAKRLYEIKEIISNFEPSRICIDSLTALQRISTEDAFREFLIGLRSTVKNKDITTCLTSTTPYLIAGDNVTEANVSTLTDSIILLRYVEKYGTIQRGILVLKMRGTPHEKFIRRFTIENEGMTIGEPFTNVSGILGGSLEHHDGENISKMSSDAREKDRI